MILSTLFPLFIFLAGSANSQIPVPPFDESNFVCVHNSLVGSPALLKALAEKEEIIFILVQNYLEKISFSRQNETPATFALAERYVTYFEATTGKLQLNLREDDAFVSYRANNVAWNSLSTYHMITRFRTYLKEIVRNLDPRNEDDYALQKQILNSMRYLGWPTELDLKETMSAILRVQHTYDLETADIVSGILNGTNTGISLSSSDCNVIGRHAMEMKYYALAVEWLEISLTNFQYYIPIYEINTYVRKANLENDWLSAVELHDDQHDKHEQWEPTFFVEKVQDCPHNKVRRRTAEFQYWKGGRTANLNTVNYWGVCSGENYQTEEQKSKLFCWYETQANAYWRINPLKAELLSFDPLQIVQYYDLIGSRMIKKIKDNASFRLARSSTLADKSVEREYTDARTSWNTWIKDNIWTEFKPIPRTIELITGLKVGSITSSEELQVASYSSGSHYNVHLDAFDILPPDHETNIPMGNRHATFIYYLSEVGKGGGTAFPQSGIATVPKKGSAVLWYNLWRCGNLNYYTWHGSCPVILGEKWIANKWIRANDQMFSEDHKCVNKPWACFEVKVNGVPLGKLVNLPQH